MHTSGRISAGDEPPAYRPKCREARIHTDSEVMPFHIPAVSGGLISLLPSAVLKSEGPGDPRPELAGLGL